MTTADYTVLSAGIALIIFVIWFFFGSRPGARVERRVFEKTQSDFAITGIHCPSCMLSIKQVLERTDGIIETSTNFESARASVTYDPNVITLEDISAKVSRLGYTATPVVEERVTAETSFDVEAEVRDSTRAAGLCSVCAHIDNSLLCRLENI